MKAIGFIETKGLLAAIEASDAMLKAAEVTLIDKAIVGGGIVTITIEGDVAAVKASVDAGAAAVERISGSTLLSTHVIPRPHESIDEMMYGMKEEKKEEVVVAEKKIEPAMEEKKELSKELIKELVERKEDLQEKLKGFRTVDLRKLARSFKDFPLTGTEISASDKKTIINGFTSYYQKK